jgi:PAS domain-containing protein
MNTMESKISPASERFRKVTLELHALLISHEVVEKLQPFRDDSLPYFSTLSTEAQTQTIGRIEMMLNLCKQTVASGTSIASPSAILETFFKNTGLSSIDGLFENVQEEDSIELFDTNHQLVFANLRIFQLISYPLEDVFCRPWTDLLDRENAIVTESLLKLGNEMLSGKRTKLTSTAVIPDHVCREKDSPGMVGFKIVPNFFAPVYHGGVIAGFLCSNHVALI